FHPDLAHGSDPAQRLDLYAPAHACPAALPSLLFVHGGAFATGYKEWMGFMAPAICATPALFISVEYRVAPGHAYPAAVRDVAAAVHWAWRNVARYGGDPDRLFLGGHSAGAHLASLAALDRRWLGEWGLPGDVVKGVLPISGLYDLTCDPDQPFGAAALAIRRRFIPNDADVEAASPVSHAHPQAPPFYIAAGEHDLGNLAAEAVDMRQRLQAAGVPVALDLLAGHDHFTASSRCVDDGHPWIARARAFLLSGRPG
ncbi:alpha/beta hydrolase, partial [Achromobacter xylosoxidans]|uniref:alpha/beta hydrolase n=3 Tax=Alcaligenaceae TaxID=506 RepID=UPI001F0DA1A5